MNNNDMPLKHVIDSTLENLKKIATRENDTPYHNYLIGLAYLNGIDVEVDSKKADRI